MATSQNDKRDQAVRDAVKEIGPTDVRITAMQAFRPDLFDDEAEAVAYIWDMVNAGKLRATDDATPLIDLP